MGVETSFTKPSVMEKAKKFIGTVNENELNRKDKEFIESTLDQKKIDLNNRLPRGFINLISSTTKKSKSQVKYILDSMRKERGIEKVVIKKDLTDLKLYTEELLNKKKYDFNCYLPYGIVPEIIKDTGESIQNIRYALKLIKKERGIILTRKKELVSGEVVKAIKTPLYDYCIENKLIRSSPTETSACNTIIHALQNIVPKGGSALLIGTPTPFCASDNCKNNMMIIDNLEVAIELINTTSVPPTIVVGNAINPVKAQLKGDHWKSNTSTNICDIRVDRVDRNTFTRYVTLHVEKSPLCKVVLLTSGVWNCSPGTKRKHNGLDMNYKEPSEYLTSVYPNLHILAMVRQSRRFDLDVRYLHNGSNEILKKEK